MSRAGWLLLPGLGLLGVLCADCGKRGDPQPPLSQSPGAITSFRLAQQGDQLELSLVAPRTSAQGKPLPVLDIELLRDDGTAKDFLKAAKVERRKAAPGEALVQSEPLPLPGTKVRIAARAVARGERGPQTATVTLTVKPIPAPPAGFAAELTATGVAMRWDPVVLPTPEPTPTPSPSPSPSASGSASPAPVPVASPSPVPSASASSAAGASPEPAGSPSPAASASPSPSPTPTPAPTPPTSGVWVYRRPAAGTYLKPLQGAPMQVSTWQDTSVQPGEDVCYVVRTVHATDPLLESGPSAESCVKVRDISPPQAPLGLSVLEADGAAELSWSPSPEADLAFYRVYKAARGGEPAPLAEVKAGETAYRDPAPRTGPVVYTLTAVDKAGNESPASSSALLR